jgi:hypothetical protein
MSGSAARTALPEARLCRRPLADPGGGERAMLRTVRDGGRGARRVQSPDRPDESAQADVGDLRFRPWDARAVNNVDQIGSPGSHQYGACAGPSSVPEAS